MHYRTFSRDLFTFTFFMPVLLALAWLRSSFGKPRHAGIPNTKMRLAMMRAGGADADRWYAWHVLEGLISEGYRPRDYPRALIARIGGPPDGSFDECGTLTHVYAHALDSGEIVWAEQVLDRLLTLVEAYRVQYGNIIYAEAAYIHAVMRGGATTARAYADRVSWKRGSERLRARVEAAVLLAEGKHAEAWTRAQQGMAIPDHVPYIGYYRAEQDWLSAIMARAMDAAPFAMAPATPAAAPAIP